MQYSFRYALIMLFFLPALGFADVSNGLMGWWQFDDGSGSTAVDSSTEFGQTGHNGTLVNSPSWVTGKKGKALSFDGSTQSVSTSLQNLNFSSGSVCWWMKPSTTYNAGTIRAIWGQLPGSIPEFSAQVYSDNNFYVGWNAPGNDARVITAASSSNYVQNVWESGCMTWSPSGSILYINGAVIGSTATAPTVSNIASNFDIGRQGEGYAQFFPGSIDDFRIYNRALTAAEVMDIYQGNSQNFGGE